MKLHLPKLLSVAVMAALVMPVMGETLTTDNIVTPVEGGDSYLNVGMESATDTWSGNLTIGDTTDTTGDVDNVGAFTDNWEWVTPNGGSSNTTYTSGLKVTGDITVQGNGKVVLGGQNSSSYMGLEATGKITVNGGTLTSTKIIANDLEVNNGSVSTSTANCTSGNSYVGGSKQSYIKKSLTLTNGSLSFGYTANVQGIGGGNHRMTAFGSSSSFTMNQSGGTMKVYGDMDLKSGSTINQTDNAGLMSLRDTIYMGSTGTTTFNQSGDSAILVLGRLESTGSVWSKPQCDFIFNQSGNGLIHLAYGSNLYKEGTISLNQTGNGTINLGGGHDTSLTGALPSRGYALDTVDTSVSSTSFESKNTTYNINQTGAGTINVASNATIIADTVSVGKDATLNVNGSLTIQGESSLQGTINVGADAVFTFEQLADVEVNTTLGLQSGNTMNFNIAGLDDNGSMQMGEGGDLNFTGGTLTLELSEVAMQEMAADADYSVGTVYNITLIDNLSEADVLELEAIINNTLVLEEYYVELPVTLAEVTTAPITFESEGLLVENNKLMAAVRVTNPGNAPEPTTATLSLLALAALVTRRRRRG